MHAFLEGRLASPRIAEVIERTLAELPVVAGARVRVALRGRPAGQDNCQRGCGGVDVGCFHPRSYEMSTSPADFNAQIIDEFHSSEGRVGGMFEGMPLLLLHHTGAKSGKSRVNPLAYQADDGRYVIFASKGGAPSTPPGTTTSRRTPTRRSRSGETRSMSSPARRPARSASVSTARRPSASRSSPSTSRRPSARSR